MRGDQAQNSGAVSYDLNGSGSMTSQSDSSTGAETSYTYDGDRLMSSSTSGGSGASSSSTYAYDDFGSTTQISGGGTGGGQTGMDYDEFGRMKKGTGPDGKAVTYTYDALDRRDQKIEDGQSQDMSYIGTSESLSEEAGAGKDRSYDYSSDMERLGQASGDGADSAYHAPARRRRCAP
jgi:hypothetical protein